MSRNNNNNSRRAYSENAPRAAFGGADSIFERRFRIAFVLVIAIVVIFGFQLLCLQVFQAADNAAMGQAAREAFGASRYYLRPKRQRFGHKR